MKPADAQKQIKSGKTEPLYLLEGDDLQSRHDLALEFSSLVDEGLQAFNVQSYYANEATTAGAREQMMADIVSNARTLPMMAPRRVLIVHEAEKLLAPRKGKDDEDVPAPAAGKKQKKAQTPAEEFEAYLENPEPLTTVVFVAGALDANRRLVKLLRKGAVTVDCGTLDSSAEAAKWIQQRLEKDSLSIEPRAINLLLEATGLSLGRIRAEVEKIVLYAAGEKTVTPRHIQELVQPASEPGEDFALGRAIWDSNAARALREVAAEIEAGKPPVMILGSIRAAAARLRPDERVKQSLDAVFRTDLQIKSSAGEPRYLLERLVVELCVRR